MIDVPGMFGALVFGDNVMKAMLPKGVYEALRKTAVNGRHLEPGVADAVAAAMKEWAVRTGATHYAHWFQPLTGASAEKQEAFISPCGQGKVIMEFSGKDLIKGEPDASSFPSGGLRDTAAARGYTAWDPSSYAFIKDGTLYIPTAFCSYSGEALDQKTPLLRSMQALDEQALRILRLFDCHTVQRVVSTIGPEQEFFLIAKEVFLRRADLVYCGRALFGARPPKGQELADHYLAPMNRRVAAFFQELEQELWKVGVPVKTKHSEVAPGQYELAVVYETINTAADHNRLGMELLKSTADNHDLVCLLHEKPFPWVNGSGKHINWSMTTDTGENLLNPGDEPHKNLRFLLFLTAVIAAVDEHQDLLRLSVASAGNDHRLGAHEAPPAIISVYLGDELTEILQSIANGSRCQGMEKQLMETGAMVLPRIAKDAADRNRTSPFAFTGDKFEFRMPGSAMSVAGPCTVLNTIIADSLKQFADALEGSSNLREDLIGVIKEKIQKHFRVVFNGDNYSQEWVVEAGCRGLLNLRTTPEALPYLLETKNIKLFERHQVLTKAEVHARYETLMESYCKTIQVEAATMIELVKKEVMPAALSFQRDLAQIIRDKKWASAQIDCGPEEALLDKLACLTRYLYNLHLILEEKISALRDINDLAHKANYCRDEILGCMQKLKTIADELEAAAPKANWTLPSSGEILYSAR